MKFEIIFRLTRFFVYFLCVLFIQACTKTSLPKPDNFELYALRLDKNSIININTGAETPLPGPDGCALWSINPAPRGQRVAVEYACPRGPMVLLLNLADGSLVAPVTQTDSRFLAWHPDGYSLFLKTDSLGEGQIVRAPVDGSQPGALPLPVGVYDISISPDGSHWLYSLTRGLGFGSETWVAGEGAKDPRQIRSDMQNIITFSRWSPDGSQIAFIALPDTQTPFPEGELWVMDADGTNARSLAPADAGRGYPPAWSPGGKWVAYVGRENRQSEDANQAWDALESNIYLADPQSGEVRKVSTHEAALVESPVWSPDGSGVGYHLHGDDTINTWIQPLHEEAPAQVLADTPACCLMWLEEAK